MERIAKRQRWVIGNWKMNGRRESNAVLLDAVRTLQVADAGVGVCVPFPYLEQARAALAGSKVAVGAQDLSEHPDGAFTGEVSASMLVDVGATLVVVGHSERRLYNGESDALVAAKTVAALRAGLRPVVCVGETLAQRLAGEHLAVVSRQLDVVLDLVVRDPASAAAASTLMVAYEPVWAIGSGQSASPEQAQEIHATLRARLAARELAATPVLYGGSVKAQNAASLFAMPDIDGGLIGGASLVAVDFIAIARANQDAARHAPATA